MAAGLPAVLRYNPRSVARTSAALRIQRAYRKKRAQRRFRAQIRNNSRYTKTLLHEIDNIAATAGGEIFERFNDNPQNASKFNDWNQVYGFYRVRSISMKYQPQDYSDLAAGNHHSYLLVAIDQEDATLPVNEDDVLQLPNCRIKPSYKPWSVYYKLNKAGEKLEWHRVDAVAATNSSIKIAASPNTVYGAAQDIGNVMITYEVEFKGVRND